MRALVGISQILSLEHCIMKVLILVFALVAVVAAEDWAPKTFDEMKAISAECIAENPVPEETVEKMKLLEYPDVEVVRKYILCNAKKIGIFCGHEGYHVDRVVKQFKGNMDEAEATDLAQKCYDSNEVKSSVDVWAFRGHKCLLKSKLSDGIKEFVKKNYGVVKA